MKNILEDITKQQTQRRVSVGDGKVSQWLQDTGKTKTTFAHAVPQNTPANATSFGYRLQTQDFAPGNRFEDPPRDNTHEVLMTSRQRPEISSTTKVRHRSDAALFGQALLENRLPKPKILTFDGDARRYKIFMASFLTNIDRMLDEGDDQMKLTLLLQHCEGDALDQIEDCVMMPSDKGYAEALQRLETTFGKNHLIARSYIDGVTRGGPIKLNDVEAIVRLSNDMRKCRNVLSQLDFTSDLDASGTLESIIARLPDNIQIQWVRKASKILDSGRSATFKDLSLFIEERAKEYSCQFGQSYAERKNAASNKSKPSDANTTNKSNQRKRNITTLATSTSTGETSMAGPSQSAASTTTSSVSISSKPICLKCGKTGHFIARCIRFKKMSLDEKRAEVKKHNLCFCCLKQGHGSAQCERTCPVCQKKHHYHLHEDSANKQDDKKQAASTDVVSLSTFKANGRASLGILRVRVQSSGKEVQCLALVDSGCNQTLLRRRVADELGIKGSPYVYTMNTMNGRASHDEI